MLFQDFSTTAGGEKLTIFFLIIKKVQVKKSSWKKQDRERKKKKQELYIVQLKASLATFGTAMQDSPPLSLLQRVC